jgi:acetyl-CoA decarbonylase/synthase complex subunit alpha
VIVVDEQCVRTDVLKEAKRFATPVVATSDKLCLGLRDRTNDACDEIVKDLTGGKEVGALILNPEKVGEVVTRVAMNLSGKREKDKKGPEREEIINEAARCTNCGWCSRHCPNGLPIGDAMKAASVENLEKIAELYELCNGCGRCENDCEREIKVFDLIAKAAQIELKEEKYVVRSGRGPIQDVEIRNVGPPIVLGEIPGVIAFVGCPNYASGYKEVAEMAEEFIKRNYLVAVSGCAAMHIARYKDEEGKTLYEKYPGNFDRGGLPNVGSCVANAHILGAAIKIPNIFARKNLRGNFEEIADYILNRVGAVAFAWGAISQKAYAIATGVNRWGIPVILGPHGSKYRRLFLGRGDKEKEWILNDRRTKRKVKGEPAPEHLVYCAESKEEAIVMAAKLCIRPNDTSRGRQIKLSHYVDLYKRNFGSLPDDLDLFVRTKSDIPITNKEEILEFLDEKGWKEREPPTEPSILDLGE